MAPQSTFTLVVPVVTTVGAAQASKPEVQYTAESSTVVASGSTSVMAYAPTPIQ